MATVLGVMMSVQYHDVLLGGAGLWASSPDIAAVTARLDAVNAYNHTLTVQTAVVNHDLIALQDKALREGGGIAQLERSLHAVRVLTGAVPLVGPGIVVSIDDGRMSPQDQSQFITHDWDLRSVVNELFLAGADAVSVNQTRITGQTGIFCIGPVVRVGKDRLGPPFVIRAIGDESVLASAMSLPGGVLDALQGANRGLHISGPQTESSIHIPASDSTVNLGGVGGHYG